jgi:carboxymethylenebutenolidase
MPNIGPGPVTIETPRGDLLAVLAAPPDPPAAVLLLHENRGLTPHFVDLVGRFAAKGYATLCIDLASAEGGSAQLGSEDAVRELLHRTPHSRLLEDVRSGLDELDRRWPVPLAVVGFCFGGALTWELLAAGESRLAAAVAFYGRAPEHADFSGSRAAVLGIYAELDDNVNATRPYAETGLRSAGLVHSIVTFDGAGHAFFNDTGARYHAQAAAEAEAAVDQWFADHLRTRTT